MKHLTVSATLDSLKTIREFVMAAARAAGLDRKTACRLRLGVDEIATNTIEHGYEQADKESLHLAADIGKRQVTIILEDRGKPYDPHQTPQLDNFEIPLEQRRTGGLGLYLALQGIDEFFYTRDGDLNRITFIMKGK